MNIIKAVETLKNDNAFNRIDGVDDNGYQYTAYKIGKIIRIDIR